MNLNPRRGLQSLLRPVIPVVYRRRFHAFAVGTGKSGTHSMAAIFQRHYRSAHEPESERMLQAILDRQDDKLSAAAVREFLRRRDRRLWLEMDSSQLNLHFLDLLVAEFPQAKFVMTIRHCVDWLGSILHHQVTRPASAQWQRLRRLGLTDQDWQHPPEEQILADHGLPTLRWYVSSWARRNRLILATVPGDRLLVLRTHEITQSLPQLADFLHVPLATLDAGRSHAFRAVDKVDLLSKISREHVAARVNEQARDLMERFFPETEKAANQDAAPGVFGV